MLKNSEKIIKNLVGLKPLIRQKIDDLTSDIKNLKSFKKSDDSIVTEADLFISNLFKQMLETEFPDVGFYCEEDIGEFKFPICILDPIDGTREFALGMDECVVSFGIYYSNKISDPRNFSWLYNPINEFEVSSEDTFQINKEIIPKVLRGLVSRSEFEKGMHKDSRTKSISPCGSIAYKLGLLAKGECDFVLTRKNKNIWDILAGTHICMKNGILLYQNNEIIDEITDQIYRHDLLWCHENDYQKI